MDGFITLQKYGNTSCIFAIIMINELVAHHADVSNRFQGSLWGEIWGYSPIFLSNISYN